MKVDSVNVIRQKGFVLPMALIVIAILTVMSLGLSRMTRGYVEQASSQKNEWRDEQLCYASFQRLIFILMAGDLREADIQWKGKSIPLNADWVEFGDVEMSLQDANGLYPIFANEYVLRGVLEAYVDKQEAEKLAARVVDWIDLDSVKRLGGMEMGDYISSNLTALPRNAPLRTLDELLNIPGITPSIYNGDVDNGLLGLKDVLQLRGAGGFNVATAPVMLLGPVLGLKHNLVDQLVKARDRKDWQEVKNILGSERFGESLVLRPGPAYVVVFRAKSGREARIRFRLTPYLSKPFEILLWNYPNYERI